jgi:two-component system CheB/CheR fusion protein
LGIGLTLVRRLVELQAGRVFASSDGPGQGSEFTVILPAGDSVPRAKGATKKPIRSTTLSPDLRILIVDDNRDVAESTAALLRLEGCEVHLAHDGEEALNVVHRLRPTAILLDIGLPKINGFEVAERIRAVPELQDILIVGVSGYGQEEHRLRSKQAGFDHHIVKPIEPGMLAALVASLRSSRANTSGENVLSFRQRKIAE